MPRLLRRLAVLTALLLCSGLAAASDHWVELAGERFQVEIAATEAQRARGLMYRERLEPGHGMLFIHDWFGPQAYWMKNTRIPLDILYFDEQRRLVSQHRDVLPCRTRDCPVYPSGAPARYVLELNAGEAARLGVAEGAELRFGPGIPAAAAE